MHQTNSISVLGCGWLGFPLASILINIGYNVKGSTTSMAKLADLAAAGIEPFLVHSPFPDDNTHLIDFLQSEILIIAVPPGRDPGKQVRYFELLNKLGAVLTQTGVKKLIFISSTSVYGDRNTAVSEYDQPVPDSDPGKRMLQAEQIISALPLTKIVLRLSGLVGPDRHPGRFLAGKTGIPNGMAPVNLIHRDDVIGIIIRLLAEENSEGIYNAVSPCHPSKEEFYSLACQMTGSSSPGFISEKKAWKIVESLRVPQELNYTFKFPNLKLWLSSP